MICCPTIEFGTPFYKTQSGDDFVLYLLQPSGITTGTDLDDQPFKVRQCSTALHHPLVLLSAVAGGLFRRRRCSDPSVAGTTVHHPVLRCAAECQHHAYVTSSYAQRQSVSVDVLI